jgi:hypothetical protein
MKRVLAPMLLSLFALAACTEKAQSLDQAKKWDAPAYSGAAKAYTAAGWSAGDKASWEQQMRTRNQRQNDYSR